MGKNLFRYLPWIVVLVPLLFGSQVTPASGAFPGGNGRIAFITLDAQGIRVMNPDGTAVISLTDGNDQIPVWSPDGSRIAFERESNIWVVNEDGSDAKQLTDHRNGSVWPAWSPDGTLITFSRPGKDAMNVWIMRADGSREKKLGRGWVPTWSPDGRKIAFHCCATDEKKDIYVMNADGTNRERLTDDSTPFDYSSDWSPRGDKILFDTIYANRIEIWVINADGTGKRRITDEPGDMSTRNHSPSWSPDGTKIVFMSNAHNPDDATDVEIYVMDADGSDRVRITNGVGSLQPDWQPACTLSGTKQDDTLTGTGGRDLICGYGGDDVIRGLGGRDVIFGGDGNDAIAGGRGADVLVGAMGDDLISGGRGNDRLVAGTGIDELLGGGGADRCVAGSGDITRSCF